jgi:hypothetical protein
VELAVGEERKDAALDADHRADKRVHDHQQAELREILAKAQTNRWLNRRDRSGSHFMVTVS